MAHTHALHGRPGVHARVAHGHALRSHLGSQLLLQQSGRHARAGHRTLWHVHGASCIPWHLITHAWVEATTTLQLAEQLQCCLALSSSHCCGSGCLLLCLLLLRLLLGLLLLLLLVGHKHMGDQAHQVVGLLLLLRGAAHLLLLRQCLRKLLQQLPLATITAAHTPLHLLRQQAVECTHVARCLQLCMQVRELLQVLQAKPRCCRSCWLLRACQPKARVIGNGKGIQPSCLTKPITTSHVWVEHLHTADPKLIQRVSKKAYFALALHPIVAKLRAVPAKAAPSVAGNTSDLACLHQMDRYVRTVASSRSFMLPSQRRHTTAKHLTHLLGCSQYSKTLWA